jgi:hypothetical protein
VIGRLSRNTAASCAVLTVVAGLWSRDLLVAGGVVGGGLLVGLAIWALAGVVANLTSRDETGQIRPISRAFALVKFFTRHAILAFVAYVMMVRLHLDPVGMIVGVTSVVVAAIIEAVHPR